MRKLITSAQLRNWLMVCCAVVFVSSGVSANNTIKFNPTVRKQQIIMIGNDIERSQSFLQSARNIDQMIEWGFVDLPFNVCRVSYDKKQEMNRGKKNFGFYDKAIKSMQMIKAASPDIEFWATMKSDYSGYNKSNNLPEWICDDRPNTFFYEKRYAVFLADYLELMEKSGVGITYLSTAKEWTQTVTAERAKKIITALNKECEKRGIKQPKYIDAATWSTAQGERYVKDIRELGMKDMYYGTATHNYNNDGKYEYSRFVNMSKMLGLLPFADESSFGSGGRNSGNDPETLSSPIRAYRDKCEFYKAGMVGEVMFEIYSRGSDPESRALYIPSKGTKMGYPLRIYYIAKQHVNSIAGGKFYTPYDYSELTNNKSVYTMSFTSDDELYICVLNDSKAALKDLRLVVEGGVQCGDQAVHTFFDQEQPREGTTRSVEVKSGVVTVDAAPGSITFVNIPLK